MIESSCSKLETFMRFVIPGEPIPKARARTYPVVDKNKKVVYKRDGKPFVKTKTPERTKAYETYVAACARRAAYQRGLVRPISGPIVLGCQFYLSPTKKILERSSYKEDAILVADKPDLSNLYKSVEDAAEGILWQNDSLIVDYFSIDGKIGSKFYSSNPRVIIEIRCLDTAM